MLTEGGIVESGHRERKEEHLGICKQAGCIVCASDSVPTAELLANKVIWGANGCYAQHSCATRVSVKS